MARTGRPAPEPGTAVGAARGVGAAAWAERLAAAPGLEARRALWAEALRLGDAPALARRIDRVVVRAATQDPVALPAYLPLLDLPGLGREAGPGRLAAVLLAARALHLEHCLLLLEYPGASGAAERLGPPPDPVLDGMSLGHRKSAARGGRSPLLERILQDPDPRVVREVLRNPRLREWEVLAIASRRPCSEAVQRLVVRAENWVRRPAVRRAVALNPYTPPQLALALAVLCSSPELDELSRQEGLHPALRDGALEILAWRRSAGTAHRL